MSKKETVKFFISNGVDGENVLTLSVEKAGQKSFEIFSSKDPGDPNSFSNCWLELVQPLEAWQEVDLAFTASGRTIQDLSICFSSDFWTLNNNGCLTEKQLVEKIIQFNKLRAKLIKLNEEIHSLL